MSATQETESNRNLPSTLSEEQENVLQLDKLRRYTVEPGVLKLPVTRVDSAENTEKFVVTLDHPVFPEKKCRVYLEKPTMGWERDQELVKVLRWYCGENCTDPYQLQLTSVRVKFTGTESRASWEILKPPDYHDTWVNEAKNTCRWIGDVLSFPSLGDWFIVVVYFLMVVGPSFYFLLNMAMPMLPALAYSLALPLSGLVGVIVAVLIVEGGDG